MVFVVAILAIWVHPADTFAQSFAGNWRHTEVVEDEVTGRNCRWFHVTTRRYCLKSQPDGRLAGSYVRQYRRLWLGPTNDCPPDVGPANAAKWYRSDLWFVLEIGRDGNRLNVHGEYDHCVGACNNGSQVLPQFRALLHQQDDMIVDVLEDSSQQFFFVSELIAITAEQHASDRMFKLLKPFYEGECTRFYENNMDPIGRTNTPKFEFCRAVQKLKKLMPPILYHKPLTATYFSFGEFRPLAGATPLRIWGGLDVLVEQFFVVAPDGSGVPVAAVLRQQPNGTWKVLVPSL